jgi:hypothetical protein
LGEEGESSPTFKTKNMKPLSSVFNYMSSVVRYAESDDDQLLSWALQAWNLLNYPTLQKVKDFDIVEIKNYKAQLPTTKDKIIGIEVANDLNKTMYDYSRSTYFTGNNLLEFTKDTTLMPYVQEYTNPGQSVIWNKTNLLQAGSTTFVYFSGQLSPDSAEYYTINSTNNTLTIASDYYVNTLPSILTIVSFQSTLVPKDSVTSSTGLMYDNPLGIQTTYTSADYVSNQKVNILTNQTIDYLCRECDASVQITGNIGTFNFDTGIILVHYYTPLKDASGEYLIPSEPEVIWHYLAKYIEEKHWYERGLMGEANGYQLYQAIKQERSNLHNDVKRKLTMMTMNIKDQISMVYGPTRFLKMATMIHRKFSRRYEGTKIS